ncbi:hypothetical protein [Chelativorans sp.]|uniref:hypothetical protein n=1 Tax=Chelativorans sp. TaxID=2203393 RepID=UPI002810D240|nr:hypothetical protein [Chelativorans sp.]
MGLCRVRLCRRLPAIAGVAGADIESEDDALWGGLGVGGSLNFADDKYSLYGEALAKTSLANFGDSHSITGTVGFRMQW